MQYGYFDDAAREYVITNPKTPVKWINYVGTLGFGGFVDHTGGALLCKGDPALNRIVKYFPQLPAAEFNGETLYLRIKTADGSYRLLSPFFTPCLTPYEAYECRVGLGYTHLISRVEGIRTEVTIFVPLGESREIRDIRVTNETGRAVEIDAIPVVEYTHFDALKQLTNADWVPQTMQSWARREEGGYLILAQSAFMKRDTGVNYLTSNLPAASFETDRRAFLGDEGYGTWSNPLSLLKPDLPCSEARRGDNIGALLHHLGTLQAGETRNLIVQLGQEAGIEEALPGIRKFRQSEAVTAALDELSRFWDAYLEKLHVETPDPALNSMVNIHNPRQCYITKTWSRYLSLYQLGFGARGIGFRDSSQDAMGVLASAPGEARDLLRLLLQVQKRDGSAMHQFNPLTMVASEGDSRERDDRPHYYSDDALWAVLAVCAYVKETGDFAFLEETLPFYDKDRTEQPLESAPVREHLRRALAFTKGDLGAHGLPRLGFADWNDTINLPTGAESLFSANLYGKALLEAIELAGALGAAEEEQGFREDYALLKERVNACAWDGEWYVSYFEADGAPMGSRQNAAGQIYAYGQSWPVISGLAQAERVRQALDSAYEMLNTRHGIKLSTPGFNGYDPSKGGITTYPPGAKENGGIFLHTNPWLIIAEALAGNGDRAYAYYTQINPAGKNDEIEVFECEPYVYPQNVLGDEHPLFGLARNSWLSGTASWMYQAATQYILGVRPGYHGLTIDPCIPSGWDGFRVVRHYRGAVYEIEVKNPGRVCKGVRRLMVDGQVVEGNTITAFGDGKVHRVEVVLRDKD